MKRLLLTAAFVLFASQLYAQVDTVKVYLSPQIQELTPIGPAWRNKLYDYIGSGEKISEIDNPARRYGICFVAASPATHAVIATDPEIISLTPNDVTPAQLQAVLDSSVSSLPSAFKTNIQNALEARGISFAWVGASNTVRDVFRYLLRIHFFAQRVEGEGNANVFDFVKQNLDTKINQVPASIRSSVSSWMTSKGLPTSWITGQTTVRQVLHFIVTDLGFGAIKIGGHSF